MFQKADPDHMLSHGTTYVRINGGYLTQSAPSEVFLIPRPLAEEPHSPAVSMVLAEHPTGLPDHGQLAVLDEGGIAPVLERSGKLLGKPDVLIEMPDRQQPGIG
jgi:hypothetical protein